MFVHKKDIKYLRKDNPRSLSKADIKVYIKQIDTMSCSNDERDIKFQINLIHELLDRLHKYVEIDCVNPIPKREMRSMFKNKGYADRLSRLEEEFENYKSNQDEKLKALLSYSDTKKFEIKYPNGRIYRDFGFWVFTATEKNNIVFQYSDGEKIKDIILTEFYGDICGYKILVKDNVTYVGVKFSSEDRYYVVDTKNETAVEVDGMTTLDKLNWVEEE